MQLCIDTLQIGESNLLVQDHLVHAGDKVCIEESAMEDCQSDDTPNKLEVVQMLWIDARCRRYLERIVVVGRIFKETVERIKHFVRKKEEEFTESRVSLSYAPYNAIRTEKHHHNPDLALLQM